MAFFKARGWNADLRQDVGGFYKRFKNLQCCCPNCTCCVKNRFISLPTIVATKLRQTLSCVTLRATRPGFWLIHKSIYLIRCSLGYQTVFRQALHFPYFFFAVSSGSSPLVIYTVLNCGVLWRGNVRIYFISPVPCTHESDHKWI